MTDSSSSSSDKGLEVESSSSDSPDIKKNLVYGNVDSSDSSDSTDEALVKVSKESKDKLVSRKKSVAKFGAKHKISENSDTSSSSSEEEYVVAKKSSCVKVEQKGVVASRSGRSKSKKKLKTQSDQSDSEEKGHVEVRSVCSKVKKKAKKDTKSEPKSIVGSCHHLKRKLQEDSNSDVKAKQQHKDTMALSKEVSSVQGLQPLTTSQADDILCTTPTANTVTMPVEDFKDLLDFVR